MFDLQNKLCHVSFVSTEGWNHSSWLEFLNWTSVFFIHLDIDLVCTQTDIMQNITACIQTASNMFSSILSDPKSRRSLVDSILSSLLDHSMVWYEEYLTGILQRSSEFVYTFLVLHVSILNKLPCPVDFLNVWCFNISYHFKYPCCIPTNHRIEYDHQCNFPQNWRCELNYQFFQGRYK